MPGDRIAHLEAELAKWEARAREAEARAEVAESERLRAFVLRDQAIEEIRRLKAGSGAA